MIGRALRYDDFTLHESIYCYGTFAAIMAGFVLLKLLDGAQKERGQTKRQSRCVSHNNPHEDFIL